MSGRQSATAAAITAHRRAARLRRPPAFRAPWSTLTASRRGGGAMATGPEIRVVSAPASRQRLGDGIALLAARNGWRGSAPDRAARASGRRSPAPSCRRARPVAAKRLFDGGHDLHRLGHAAGAEFAAGHFAVIGADEQHAVLFQRREVALRRGVLSHIRTFIAGAISTFLSVASRAVEARSLASPFASLAIRSAVAGATTTRSALRDSWIWPISASSVRLNRSWIDFLAGQRRHRKRRDELRARPWSGWRGTSTPRSRQPRGPAPGTCRPRCRRR